jgi:hypothetical protein
MKKYQMKTDNEGNEYFIPLNEFNEMDDGFKKYRNPLSHLKPKKKKRK